MRRRPVTVAVVVVASLAAAALVAATVAAVTARAGTPSDSDQVARQRAVALAEDLAADFDGTLRALPPWAIARLDSRGLQGLPVSGTVAVTTGIGCVGTTVQVGADWVTDGDQAAVEVGPVGDLPTAACGR